MDGVNSMIGNVLDLCAFVVVVCKYGALFYVDDAYGFGVIGECSWYELCDYGICGNSIVCYFDEIYDDFVFVGGFLKVYLLLLVFIVCLIDVKDLLKVGVLLYLYFGLLLVVLFVIVLVGFDVNECCGDVLRVEFVWLMRCVIDCLYWFGVYMFNCFGFFIIEILLCDHMCIDVVGCLLFECGVYVMLVVYLLVFKDEVGFCAQFMLVNIDVEVDMLIDVIEEFVEVGELQIYDLVTLVD